VDAWVVTGVGEFKDFTGQNPRTFFSSWGNIQISSHSRAYGFVASAAELGLRPKAG